MCNACGFLCCASDEFGGCGCEHCGEPECLRLCKYCGENECDGFCQSGDDDDYFGPFTTNRS
jgi:hypothetical protein